ncbi:ABC-2 transporter permease [Priestia megaterium]|uniref:ABC-2 transporter permease n=1 Tax=Priestia megaterium TaxID=1404 RepID=UPI00215ABD02|nr:ABC-2 transporter permease [Priestia megaterium]MCR8862729.1 ABC-2 transporter permease [Priestia megaterium]
MRGLLLTNYYLIHRSFLTYTALAIVISADPSFYRIIAMLIILLMAMPVLEVIKLESKTGYDKYVLTLPVSRKNVVQSHYVFYFLIVVSGTILSYGVFSMYSLISKSAVEDIVNIVAFGTFIVLFAGALAYPLLYVFGAEKSDGIVLGGGMGGLFVAIALQGAVGYFVEILAASSLPIASSLHVPILYTLFGMVMYIASYFIALSIYRKREF